MASLKRTVTGVNLGGWLVLEPWMAPALFAGTGAQDEYSFCAQANADQRRALRRFRDSFITEDDFVWLADKGVQAVRLPVGYWLFGEQGPYEKTYQYVDMVFRWAKRHNIGVLLDFHGAPGSQNGKMHSGQIGEVAWHQDNNQALTLTILERLAKRYGKQPALRGISLLNEPTPQLNTALYEQFYRDARRLIQPHCRADVWLVFSDNFKPRRWRGRLTDMSMDYHHYQIFKPLDKKLPVWVQLLRARFLLPIKITRLARQHQLVVGEWSAALPRRATNKQRQQYVRYQRRAFAGRAAAIFYWNYKTERGGSWSFRDMLESNMFD